MNKKSIAHEKLSFWQLKNKQWINALDALDIKKIALLHKEGFPKRIEKYLTKEDAESIGFSDYEKLGDQHDEELHQALQRFFVNPMRDDVLEQINPYMIYEEDHAGFLYRQHYFSYIKNINNGYVLFKELSKNKHLNKEIRSWLVGAIYNKDHRLFDKLYHLYEKTEILSEYNMNLVDDLSRGFLVDGTYYNSKSWIKYYKKIFPIMVEYKIKKLGQSKVDIISSVFLELIDFPLEEYENTEKGKNKTQVEPILKFLIKDYLTLTGIDNFEYMMVNILIEKQKELSFLNEKYKQADKSKPTRSFKLLLLENKISINEEKLRKYIDLAIKNNEFEKTFWFFKSIDLNENYYQELLSYINLDGKLTTKKEDITNKVNKI